MYLEYSSRDYYPSIICIVLLQMVAISSTWTRRFTTTAISSIATHSANIAVTVVLRAVSALRGLRGYRLIC